MKRVTGVFDFENCEVVYGIWANARMIHGRPIGLAHGLLEVSL